MNVKVTTTVDGLTSRLTTVMMESSTYSKCLSLSVMAFVIYRTFFKARSRPMLPKHVPIDIILTSICILAGGTAQKFRNLFRRYGGPLFGFTSSHQVIYDPTTAERLLIHGQPNHTLETKTVLWSMYVRVGAADKTEELYESQMAGAKELTVALERGFLNETNAADAITRGDIPSRISELLSFTEKDDAAMKSWERAADVKLVRPDRPHAGQPGIMEVNLSNLMRDFGAHLAISLLFGRNFLDQYPECLEDLWKFEEQILPLAVGMPKWAPFKSLKAGLAARTRLVEQMSALYKRMADYQAGVGGAADVGDVSTIALDRSAIFTKHKFSYEHRGIIEASLLLGQNSNTQRATSWFIVFIYCTPGLLDQLRDEIAPYVTISSNPGTGNQPKIVRFDHTALHNKCPLLKSAMYETFRLTNEPSSTRYVSRPLVVPGSDSTGGKGKAKPHVLQPGTWVSALHYMVQHDPSVYASPGKFFPGRFLEVNEATGKKVARFGRMKPWGVGAGICRGRTYAEKQVLGVAAAFMSLWDIEPVDGTGGVLKVPQGLPGTGTRVPVQGIRVRLKRRDFA